MRFRLNARTLKVGIGLAAVLALLLAGVWLLHTWEESRGAAPNYADEPVEDGLSQVYYDGAWYAPKEDLETVLVLGLDRSQEEDIPVSGNYAQSDFVLLLVIDKKAETCTPILLNRDTMVEIQDFDQHGRPSGTYEAQLALAYAHAQAYTGNEKIAAKAAMDAVSGLLYGVKIDHYATLTMDGVVVLNDLVGGVAVEIEDDFSAVDDTLVQGETVTLSGQHALNYIRARWWVGDNSNLERMERQRKYLSALRDKLSGLAEQDGQFVMDALLEVNEHMTSDCTMEQLNRLAENVGSFQMEDYVIPDGQAVMGEQHVVFLTDQIALQKLVMEYFYECVEKP